MNNFLKRAVCLFFSLIQLAIMLSMSLAPISFANDKPLENVILQLRWNDQFQFAGYYAADWMGFYKDEGISVEIRPGFRDGQILKATDEVAQGYAHFGVGASDILIAKDNGADLKLVASFFQRSAVAYYALASTKINSTVDLTKLNVARRKDDLLDVELQAIFLSEGISPKVKKYSNTQRDYEITDLTSHAYDVVPAYLGKIPYAAHKDNIDIKTIKPIDYGIDFYGDTLFVAGNLASSNPDLVERFRRASVKGWEYALEHPREISRRIAKEFADETPGFSEQELYEFNMYQSEKVKELMHYPIVEVGNMNPYRWKKMADVLAALDIIHKPLDIDSMIFDYEKIKFNKLDETSKLIFVVAGAFFFAFAIYFVVYLKSKNEELETEIGVRIKAEEKLKLSMKRYETIFNSSVIGITITDNEGKIIQCNDAWLKMTGLDEKMITGMNIHDLLAPDSYNSDDDLLRNLLDGRIDSYVIEKKYKRWTNGNEDGFFYGKLFMTRIYDIDTGGMVKMAMNVDITREVMELEENRKKEAIITYQARMAAVGEMIANIAHQWRQPLNALNLILTNMKDSLDYGECDKDYLDSSFEKSSSIIQRMSATIDDFRNFANPKTEAGEFEVLSSIKMALDLLEGYIKSNSIDVDVDEHSSVVIYGHENQFSQAIFNMITNSIDALKEKNGERKIDIEIDQNESDMILVISDNGVGISPDNHSNIFEKYFTTKKISGGTGLGLYMTRMIIENNFGGKISLKTAGGRTSFVIAIPLKRGRAGDGK